MTAPAVATIRFGASRAGDMVPTGTPTLSWTVRSELPAWVQAAAEIELQIGGRTRRHLIEGRQSVHVPWPFPALNPRESARIRVRVTGEDGHRSAWSESSTLRAGFLAEGEWCARLIAVATPLRPAQPAVLQRTFHVLPAVRSATLYATAVGAYQVEINGKDIDDHLLKPGWPAFDKRAVHDTTDVTALLTPGTNVISVRLAGGWATERFGFGDGARTVYAEQPAFAAQLLIEYTDGSRDLLCTDDRWVSASGPLMSSGVYAGEEQDARRALPDNADPSPSSSDPDGWAPVAVLASGFVPQARIAPPVRRMEELAVREVITTPSGRTVLDFGQNLVGRLKVRVSGPEGTTITFRHAEVLEGGELCTRLLRAAAATDRYTLAGVGVECWEPEFTFHGFRYAEIEGWPGAFDPANVTAVVVHSDMERIGWFDTSHPLLRRLHENVLWSLRGNFLSVPTDCPQRDERLGWTGDIQVFAPTAAFLYDIRGFLGSWLRDLALEQEDGVVPLVVPNVLSRAQPVAAWGDAAAIVPSVLHERFADTDIVKSQFESMKAWADAILRIAGGRLLWEGMFQFGDWLDPDAPAHAPARGRTDPDLVASAYLYRSLDLVARAASIVGRSGEAEYYARKARTARESFLAEYVTPAGRIMSDSPTAYALAVSFGIADGEVRQRAGDRLAALIRTGGYRIATGFVGTPLVQDALILTGHQDTADRLLCQTECPSWLYPVTMGATTVWERWDSLLPDGSVNPGEMTSFNHYALGAVADWMHRRVAGLAPASPGYGTVLIAPTPLQSMDFAVAEHITPYGKTRAGWKREGDSVIVHAEIPPNADAIVHLPDGQRLRVGSGSYRWSVHIPQTTGKKQLIDLDSSLAEIISEPDAHRTVLAVIEEHAPGEADAFRNSRWLPAHTLRERLDGLVDCGVVRAVEAALSELAAGKRDSLIDFAQ